uniref:Uncharacterized protein n=1 Tax=Ditylenchus dipsaci TaxID=166011 RepID=A0A915CYY3_9BILA
MERETATFCVFAFAHVFLLSSLWLEQSLLVFVLPILPACLDRPIDGYSMHLDMATAQEGELCYGQYNFL